MHIRNELHERGDAEVDEEETETRPAERKYVKYSSEDAKYQLKREKSVTEGKHGSQTIPRYLKHAHHCKSRVR